jgi:hypothetical protein
MRVKNWGSLRVRSTRLATVAALAFTTAGIAGCGSATVREGQAASYLVINLIEAANGAEGDSAVFSAYLQSDIRTGGGIFEDPGRVRMTAAMKDVTNPAGPSSNNAITVRRYRVVFRRADGRNVPGVDVPYPFDGGLSFTVRPGEEELRVPFVLVRVQSKLDPPLANMYFGQNDGATAAFPIGGAGVLSTLADVTFYGTDQTGREVQATGTISVNFADWADPD